LDIIRTDFKKYKYGIYSRMGHYMVCYSTHKIIPEGYKPAENAHIEKTLNDPKYKYYIKVKIEGWTNNVGSPNTDIYSLAARVKNLARMDDASLTPIGEALCNIYIHVLVDFYEYAETLPEPHKTSLTNLIESKESFCRDVMELNRKKKK